MQQQDEKNWYVCYTRPRWEKKLAATLPDNGFECYAPLHKVRRKWSDRYKVVEMPLFTGYIFVNVSEKEKWDVLSVPGILNFVRHNGVPAIVPDEEINRIRNFLNEFEEVRLVKEEISKDSNIVITKGLFMDYKGIVLEVSGNKAKVRVNSLGVSLVATFPINHLINDKL